MHGLETIRVKNAEESVRRAIRRRGEPHKALLNYNVRADIIEEVHDAEEPGADSTQWNAVLDRVAAEECKCSPY